LLFGGVVCMLPNLTQNTIVPVSTSELRKKAGRWLRARRCELGLSQRELASRVNMEYYTFISQIEAGRGRVPSDRLRDWADALEMEPKEFAINLMKYYDPLTFDMIFGSNE
jgi:transcriptional regulator with XRE-family HTH domain